MRIENLIEGIGERKLYHYTNFYALKDILASKQLKGFKYKIRGDEGYQIATVRPSMANKKNIGQLSKGTDQQEVRIIINASKLSDNIRGTKIRSIAEYPKEDTEKFKKLLGSRSKEVNSFIKEINAYAKKYPEYKNRNTPKGLRDIEKILKRYGVDKKEKEEALRFQLGLSHYSVNREGEERINIKKDHIPLSPNFIKIELLKKPKGAWVRKMVMDNRHYFVKNKVLEDLLKEE